MREEYSLCLDTQRLYAMNFPAAAAAAAPANGFFNNLCKLKWKSSHGLLCKRIYIYLKILLSTLISCSIRGNKQSFKTLLNNGSPGVHCLFYFFFCEWQCRILCEYLIRITSHGKCLQSLKISQQLRERTCWRVSGRVACGCCESPWRVCPRDKAGPLQPSLQANCD